MNIKSRPFIFAGVALASALTLSACGEDAASGLEPKVRPSQQQAANDPEPEESPNAEEPEGPGDIAAPETNADPETNEDPEVNTPSSGSYEVPEWARDVNQVGDLVATVDGDWIQIEVYRVGDGQATRDSLWVDSDTDEPLMKVGDPVVALNFIVTNTGSEEFLMSNLFLSPNLRYESSESLYGAMNETNHDWLEQLGVNVDPFTQYPNPAVFPVAPGESISYAQIFQHASDTAQIYFDITPVDSEGELDFDGKFNERFDATFEME